MKNKNLSTFLWGIAGIGLILTILPAILVFTKTIAFSLHITLMTIGMFMWFGARIAIQNLSQAEEVEK